MKAKSKQVARFISLVAAGLLVATASQAATIPSSTFDFTPEVTDDVFSVRSKGWRDPAFGDMGWTHSSDWGTVNAKRGELVTIKMVAADAGIHPGITVWFRGADDTAPDNYVVDHFYPQNANFTKFGATNETTGEALGNIIMRHIAHAYDRDGNTKRVTIMHPKTDGVAGQLELTFKAPRTGHYMFVVGGFNPDAGVDSSLKYNVNVNVTVTAP
ncbi:MAG: copper(I)-binding protein CorA [Methylovulum sp.]|nr:copper(I)-binding protein CorA [Methylovulum sp.]